jgi:hypothetical protein
MSVYESMNTALFVTFLWLKDEICHKKTFGARNPIFKTVIYFVFTRFSYVIFMVYSLEYT